MLSISTHSVCPAKMVVFHDSRVQRGLNGNFIRFAISNGLLARSVLNEFRRTYCNGRSNQVLFAAPLQWQLNGTIPGTQYLGYQDSVPVPHMRAANGKFALAVCNGRFITRINHSLIEQVLSETDADVLAVNVTEELLAYREKICLTSQGKMAGFRRVHCDSIGPCALPEYWPPLLLIKTGVLEQMLFDCGLCKDFGLFVQKCRSEGFVVRSTGAGGVVWDLDKEQDLLDFALRGAVFSQSRKCRTNGKLELSGGGRITGRVLLGKNVTIGTDALVVGPAVISDDVRIEPGAVIRSSIIGPDVIIGRDEFISHRVVTAEQPANPTRPPTLLTETGQRPVRLHLNKKDTGENTCAYRTWPKFSYARLFKRLADVVAAVIVLVLFAPVMPFIALAIKLNSPGTIFYRHKRQGRHGKVFNCLKFRTMRPDADEMQQKLRVANQVDGPQFMMEDDPRVSSVGAFLRETYIDEIPQFINVLLGQMSVVGPRPSPEAENILCPTWRDARLSVRPGITGLWQICRTRDPGKDFQEWIYYDIKYVKELSFKLDLWICQRTARHFIKKFARKF